MIILWYLRGIFYGDLKSEAKGSMMAIFKSR